ncbi:MAG: zinc metallopeptidase [Ruminococcus sp.]|nr:zinc metallopeptidase [Ruminococcus sp.]MBR6669520.1 zinc metallopeptidase [Ruminococcus sp.]
MDIILLLIALLVSMWASFNVKSTFKKYSKVYSNRGYTAEQVARKILDENGLYNVGIERVSGNLSDHYDPRENVVRLSDTVYGQTSVAAIGVAAHECGHAVQHAQEYTPIKIRTAIIPVTQFGSTLSYPLILIGFLMGGFNIFTTIGIWLYVAVVVFQLVTLPVEFNASSRALKTLEGCAYLEGEENAQARKVLTAAALTYVAALFAAVVTLIRLILMANRRR